MVKEADALADAGYQVTVLYAYWNDWGTQHDQELLPEKKWKAILVGGDPRQNRLVWILSRLIFKAGRFIAEKTGFYKYSVEFAIARSSYFLIKEAKKHKADLYIGHNPGALPAVVKTAGRYKKPCGFDAEDFHRQEVSDNVDSFHFKLCKFLEDKYLPLVDYITASSPLIAAQYASLYNREVTSILNVFPKIPATTIINYNKNGPLKLFWFSQTIGPSRGLEMIIEAMGLTKTAMELHILGQPAYGYKERLLQMAQTAGIADGSIHFYEPIKGGEIFPFAAQFDIGLASETGFSLNNSSALSNKLFTYMQSGLAVAASGTPAQSGFIREYPQTGKIYSNEKELSLILTGYDQNRELLIETKQEAFRTGQSQLNWEMESQKFLSVVKEVLSKN